jgi:endo-alpha-1,4-polygalactosaminidase (GH114 family)
MATKCVHYIDYRNTEANPRVNAVKNLLTRTRNDES